MIDKDYKYKKNIFAVLVVLGLLSLGTLGYFYYQISDDIKQNTKNLEQKVLVLQNENLVLSQNLQIEKQKNGEFEAQIGQISGTVGNLDKLAKTDKELLQKYSKVYFLNENYTPKKLIEVPKEYVYEKNKVIQIHASTSPFLLNMVEDAKKDNINLLLISGFRSFNDQMSLKGNYKLTYGSGANKFSADQGYSEHQLGTAIDFTSLDLGADFTNFGKSKEYTWLLQNAHKYGFILSYPKDNVYYQYEPWHFRFVGKLLAERLYEENQNFYDLDQRKIDAYLINIFD
ncbi:MAG: M15 family metallopeptidase [Candidatus Paceibacterota bacterium]|jgi:D-alanyl-D-alanine carboxypeptidase